MEKILVDYEINEHTMALLPASHLLYQTIVIEPRRRLFVKKTPMQLIKKACLEGGATYEGRRESMIYQTGAKQKTPIPINPAKNIFAFPTESPNNYNCKWIFYNHILSLKPNHNSSKSNHLTTIMFNNGQELPMIESYYLLDKQMARTAMCMLRFSHMGSKSFYLHERMVNH